MNINITKLIHINPQSKGSLGKSFEAEFRTAWLDYHQISWNGSDLDDRHHSFFDRRNTRRRFTRNRNRRRNRPAQNTQCSTWANEYGPGQR